MSTISQERYDQLVAMFNEQYQRTNRLQGENQSLKEQVREVMEQRKASEDRCAELHQMLEDAKERHALELDTQAAKWRKYGEEQGKAKLEETKQHLGSAECELVDLQLEYNAVCEKLVSSEDRGQHLLNDLEDTIEECQHWRFEYNNVSHQLEAAQWQLCQQTQRALKKERDHSIVLTTALAQAKQQANSRTPALAPIPEG